MGIVDCKRAALARRHWTVIVVNPIIGTTLNDDDNVVMLDQQVEQSVDTELTSGID